MSSAAQAAPLVCGTRISEVPTKKLRIYNNSETTLYAFMQSPERSGEGVQDLWMQAVCGVKDWTFDSSKGIWVTDRKFQTTRNYRAYIETGFTDKGIPPHGWVEITVPYYTQLKTVTAENMGKGQDQYIDWWEGGRNYLFDSAAAFNSAIWSNALGIPASQGGGLPQPDVTPKEGAALPTCVAHKPDNSLQSCSIFLKEVKINPGNGIPFQLQEITFGSPEGPPLNNKIPTDYHTTMGLEWVNYNVSSLDSVFMPVAMGPLDTTDPQNFPVAKWVGSDKLVSQVREVIGNFSDNGKNWPFFIPIYFDSKVHDGFPSSTSKACSVLVKFTTDYAFPPYSLPVIPGTFNLLLKSWVGAKDSGADFPPTPPDVSSNPNDWGVQYDSHKCSPSPPPIYKNPPALGDQGNHIVDLWRLCLNRNDRSKTCQYINDTVALFKKSYTKNCASRKSPPWQFSGNGRDEVTPWQLMTAVYGWVPVSYDQCGGFDLKLTAEAEKIDFKGLQQNYCKLQYNYLSAPSKFVFNPYTQFIHGKFNSIKPHPALGSTAYAFSIDDALAFIHRPSTGAIMAIGGTNGLVNKEGFKIPENEQQALEHCRQD
jgi:hypothetical protein